MNSDQRLLRELEHIKSFKSFDVDQEWEQFLTIAESSESSKNESDNIRRLSWRAIMAVAASVIILVGLFSLFRTGENVSQPQILVEEKVVIPETELAAVEAAGQNDVTDEPLYPITAASVTEQNAIVSNEIPGGLTVKDHEQFLHTVTKYDLKMDDGTVIAFEPGSEAIVLKKFEGAEERSVRMISGSAIFDVESNDRAPFKIYTENAGIKVLGTVFRVDTKMSNTRVENIEGQVMFYALSMTDDYKVLNQGDIVEYDGKQFALLQEGGPDFVAKNVSELTIKSAPSKLNIPDNPKLMNLQELHERVERHNYTMKGLSSLLKQFAKNKVIVDSKEVLKQDFTNEQTLFIPVDYLYSDNDNLLPLLVFLDDVIDISYVKSDKCDNCYQILSLGY